MRLFKYPQLFQRNISHLMFPESKSLTLINRVLYKLGIIKRPGKDWYKTKGYTGFVDYYTDQQNEELQSGRVRKNKAGEIIDGQGAKSKYHTFFKDCVPFETPKDDRLTVKLANGKKCKIDTIAISPSSEFLNRPENKELPGINKHIICFWGTNSFYEAQGLVDMSMQAKATGATMHTLNYPGMNRSTGRVREHNDLVNAGIAMVHDLLKKDKSPDDIIIQGNCFGATVGEDVRKHFKDEYGINIRFINSNTFKSLKSVVKAHIREVNFSLFGKKFSYKRPRFLIKLNSWMLKILAKGTGWHVQHAKTLQADNPGEDDIVHIQRTDDKTLGKTGPLAQSSKYKNIQGEKYELYVPEDTLKTVKNKDPHLAGLHQCRVKIGGVETEQDVYSAIINPFLRRANAAARENPQTVDMAKLGEPKFKKSAVPRIIKQILITLTIAGLLLALVNPITLPYIINGLALIGISLPISSVFIPMHVTLSAVIAIGTAVTIGVICTAHIFEYILFNQVQKNIDKKKPDPKPEVGTDRTPSSDSDSDLSDDEDLKIDVNSSVQEFFGFARDMMTSNARQKLPATTHSTDFDSSIDSP